MNAPWLTPPQAVPAPISAGPISAGPISTGREPPAGRHGGRRPPGRQRFPGGGPSAAVLTVGLVAVALNLRIGVASVGPVLSSIRADLGLSATVASLLTTIPVVAFGAFAFLAPWLTRRLDMHQLLGLAMAALAAGIGMRRLPGVASLFAGTVVVGAAIAIANVVMPALIKRDFPDRVGAWMSVYSTSLFLSAAIADGLTVPLLPLAGGRWRLALALWTFPAVGACLLWLPQFFRVADRGAPAAPGGGQGRTGQAGPTRTAGWTGTGGRTGADGPTAGGLKGAGGLTRAGGLTGAGGPTGQGSLAGADALAGPSEPADTGRPAGAGARTGAAGPAGAGALTEPGGPAGTGGLAGAGGPSFRAVLGDPVAIAVTAFMGVQSVGYYVTLTWLPTLLQDHGMDPHDAGWMLSFSAFPGIAAALVSPALARRIRPAWAVIVISVLCYGGAYAGLAVAPVRAPYLWMTLLGLGQGASISLSLSYMAWRSPDARHTAQVSTMAQGFGYLTASLGPIGIGAVHAASGGWTVPLAVLAALLVPQLIAGVLASRERQVLATRETAASQRAPRQPAPADPPTGGAATGGAATGAYGPATAGQPAIGQPARAFEPAWAGAPTWDDAPVGVSGPARAYEAPGAQRPASGHLDRTYVTARSGQPTANQATGAYEPARPHATTRTGQPTTNGQPPRTYEPARDNEPARDSVPARAHGATGEIQPPGGAYQARGDQSVADGPARAGGLAGGHPRAAAQPVRATTPPEVDEPTSATEPMSAAEPTSATEPTSTTEPTSAAEPTSTTEPGRAPWETAPWGPPVREWSPYEGAVPSQGAPWEERDQREEGRDWFTPASGPRQPAPPPRPSASQPPYPWYGRPGAEGERQSD